MLRSAISKPANAIVGFLLQEAADQADGTYQLKRGEEFKGRQTLRVDGIFGSFPIKRDYYYHAGKKEGHYPADAALGLEGACTPALAKLMCLEGADESSYQKAQRHLREIGGIETSARQIQRLVQKVGAAAQCWQERPLQSTIPQVPVADFELNSQVELVSIRLYANTQMEFSGFLLCGAIRSCAASNAQRCGAPNDVARSSAIHTKTRVPSPPSRPSSDASSRAGLGLRAQGNQREQWRAERIIRLQRNKYFFRGRHHNRNSDLVRLHSRQIACAAVGAGSRFQWPNPSVNQPGREDRNGEQNGDGASFQSASTGCFDQGQYCAATRNVGG